MKVNRAILTKGLFLAIWVYCAVLIITVHKTKTALEIEKKLDLPYANSHFHFKIEEDKKELTGQIPQMYGEPVYFSITNIGEQEITPQLVVNNQDWLSNEAILKSSLTGKTIKKDEDFILAIWKFIVENRYHYYPVLYEPEYAILENPVQYFNSWGYGFCSDSAMVLAQLAELAGIRSRVVYLKEHVVAEVFYEGRWHMLDADRKNYYRNVGGDIASVQDILDEPRLLEQTKERFNLSDWIYEKQLEAYSSKEPKEIVYADSFFQENLPEDFKYSLRAGEEIRSYYEWKDKFYWGWKPEEPPIYSNGILISLSPKKSFLSSSTLNKKEISFQLPYPIVGSYVYGRGVCYDMNKIEFSLDGKTWEVISGTCRNNLLDLSEMIPIGKGTKPTHEYFLKAPKSLINRVIITQFQVAPKSIPRPHSGDNTFKLKKPLNEDIKVKFGFNK